MRWMMHQRLLLFLCGSVLLPCSCSVYRKIQAGKFNEALMMNDAQRVERYLDRGFDPNFIQYKRGGFTALHEAAIWNRKAIAEQLIAHGAMVNAKDNYERTPLYFALSVGSLDVAKILLAHGADPNNANFFNGNTPLYELVADQFHPKTRPEYCGQRKEMIQELIKAGADVNRPNILGKTPKDVADKNKDGDLSEFLAGLGGNNSKPVDMYEYERTHGIEDCDSIMKLAIHWDETGVIERYLKRGYNPNKIVDPDFKRTLIYTAAEDNSPKAAEVLIIRGASMDFNDGSAFEWTPFDYACKKGSMDVVKVMLAHGVDIHEKSSEQPLMTACSEGYTDIAALLIQHGAKVNAKDKFGATPLHHVIHAVYEPHAKAKVQHSDPFIKVDAVTGIPDERRDVKKIVEILIKNGADVNAKDGEGHTPLDIAEKNHFPEMAALLRSHGGKAGHEIQS